MTKDEFTLQMNTALPMYSQIFPKNMEKVYQIFKQRLMDELEVQVHPRGATAPLRNKI